MNIALRNQSPAVANSPQFIRAGLAAASFALVAGCGGSQSSSRPESPATAMSSDLPHEGAPKSRLLTFDDLGGGSSIIQVYPGPANTKNDLQSNGTFADGQTAQIVCKTEGRTIVSDPSVGERYRKSDVWYEITSGGQEYFATKVYADIGKGAIQSC